MDSFICELQLRDEQPLGLDTLTSTVVKPFLPDSYVTIEQTYEFGHMPMARGGRGFLVAKHFMSNQEAYQTGDSGGFTDAEVNPVAGLGEEALPAAQGADAGGWCHPFEG